MPAPLSIDDRFALLDLAARYADAVDRRDFALLDAVFLPDGVLDTGRGVRDGLIEILAAMEGLRRYEATAHVLGQQLADAAGDGARGVTYCTAHHLADRDGSRTDTVMHIRYHDDFVRTPDGWRIRHRRLELQWTDRRPVSSD
jgi:hypothetical protein